MPLSEEQIQRYSRQILLAEVGGTGQSRLLGSGAQIIGEAAAARDAAAYLAGSGVQVALDAMAEPGEAGFLTAAEPIQQALRDLNPEAIGPLRSGCIAALPAAFIGEGPWIAIGGRGQQGTILYRSEKGCQQCFRKNLAELQPSPAGVSQVLLGALAALVFQRLRLNLSANLGEIWVAETGRIGAMDVASCSRCI